jgi:hypothetical protein
VGKGALYRAHAQSSILRSCPPYEMVRTEFLQLRNDGSS